MANDARSPREAALRDGDLAGLRRLNEELRDDEGRRAHYWFFASHYLPADEARAAALNAIVANPSLQRAYRRLGEICDASPAERQELERGRVPDRLVPAAWRPLMREETGLVERAATPDEAPLVLPEPIGRFNDSHAFPPRQTIVPQPLEATRVRGATAYWDARSFQPFVEGAPVPVGNPDGQVAMLSRSYEQMLAAGRVLRFDTPVHLAASPGPRSFYHWMLDIVPQIAAAKALFPGAPVRRICCNGTKLPFQKALMRLVEPDAAITEINRPTLIEAPEIVWVRHDNAMGLRLPEWIVAFWNALLDERSRQAPRTGPRHVYLVRRETSGRALVPADAVSSLLRSHDFAPVLLEDMPLLEQFALFRNAEMIVAPHGAGLAHAVFMRPGAVLLEIFGDHMTDTYRCLAGRRGAHYIPVSMAGKFTNLRSRTPAQRDATRHADIEVDLPRLTAALELAMAVRSA